MVKLKAYSCIQYNIFDVLVLKGYEYMPYECVFLPGSIFITLMAERVPAAVIRA